MEVLYPMFYGTRLVTFDVLRNTFEPHMHPEAARRGFGFILHQGGKFGVGGGYRPPGTQPTRTGFAPPGKSFHEGQQFPSGLYYVAWDMVVVNPGGVHRSPRWSEVPVQGSVLANNYGWHMNAGTPGTAGSEAWHAQPIEIDGYGTWVNQGRPDLKLNRPIVVVPPKPPVPQPPTPPPATQPVTQGVLVEFTSRNLVEGSVGSDVKFFQRILNDIGGQGLLLDGHYGPKTTQAVRNWQIFFGLFNDGQMGPKTQRSIIEIALQA